MKIGPRYLPRYQFFPESELEKAALLASLTRAPGVLSIGAIEAHHKGGHRVSLDVDRARLDDFIVYMESQGWIDGM